MPRHYTDEEKRLVLDRLIANHGDVDLTVSQTGISERTIARWKRLALRNGSLMPPPPPIASLPSPVTTGEGSGVGVDLPTETAEAFQTLHDKLLAIAEILSNRIVESIDEAPLNQRMTALSQLIDRIAKLASLLPAEEEEIEYVYEYEVEHHVEKRKEADEENREKADQDQTED